MPLTEQESQFIFKVAADPRFARYAPIAIAAERTWRESREVRPGQLAAGLDHDAVDRYELLGQGEACLIGASLVGVPKTDGFRPDAANHYRVSGPEIEAIIVGFDSWKPDRCDPGLNWLSANPRRDLDAYDFGYALGALAWGLGDVASAQI